MKTEVYKKCNFDLQKDRVYINKKDFVCIFIKWSKVLKSFICRNKPF